MSQNKDDAGKGAVPPMPDPLGQKRPYATLDLKATEVKPAADPAKASAPGASSGPKPGDTSKPSAAGSSPADAKTAAKSETSSGTSKSAPPPHVVAHGGGSPFGRFLSFLSAAVLGALLALFGLEFMGGGRMHEPTASPAGISELASRLARLEKAASERPGVPATDTGASQRLAQQLSEANARIARLEETNQKLAALTEAQQRLAAETKGLEQRLASGAAALPPDQAARIAKLEETIQSLAAAAQAAPGRPLPELARLGTRIGELETGMAQLRKGNGADLTAQIDARLAEARKNEAQTTESVNQLKSDSAKRVRDIEAVKTQTERLENRVETVKAGLDQALAAARAEASVAKSAVDALKAETTAQLQGFVRQGDIKGALEPVDKRVAGLEGRIEAAAKRDLDRQANAERIVLALELANLKRVMETGKPYSEPLAQIERLAGISMDLTPLKGLRDKGMPTNADLQARFREMARAALDAEQDQGQTSTVNRLLASAKSVVHIRKVGDVAGDTTEAVLARTEHNLKAGDLEQAAREMRGLKPETKRVAQAWQDQLEARLAVDRALKTIEDKLKSSLAGGKGDK